MSNERKWTSYRLGGAVMVLASCGLISQGVQAQATDLECSRCVDTSDLAADAVTSGKIADEAVTTADLAFRAVTAEKIAPGAIGEGKLADRAVTQTKLAKNSVGTNKIIDGAVERRKLAANAVGTNKIENGVVTFEKLSADFQSRFLALEEQVPTAVAVSGGAGGVMSAHGAAASAGAEQSGTNLIATQEPVLARTLVVGGGAPADNCAALQAALASLAGSGRDNSYLIRLRPGEYDCRSADTQSSPVAMREYVDMEGSGQAVTVIRGNTNGPAAGVVQLASHAELRGLSVENEAGASAHAIYVPAHVRGRVVNVTLKGGRQGEYDQAIACAPDAKTPDIVVMSSVLESAVAAQDAGCTAVYVDTQFAMKRIASGDTCIASYNDQFTPLDSGCSAANQ